MKKKLRFFLKNQNLAFCRCEIYLTGPFFSDSMLKKLLIKPYFKRRCASINGSIPLLIRPSWMKDIAELNLGRFFYYSIALRSTLGDFVSGGKYPTFSNLSKI